MLAAAAIAGVDRVIAIGGAQAVAALAYGTASVPRVDKIVGPGNAYVAAAKRQVFGQVGIDMIAGPSEILVIGDGSDARRLGGDGPVLAGRARRGRRRRSCCRPAIAYLDDVEAEHRQADCRDAAARGDRGLAAARGALIQTRNLDEACAIANRIAPEHLELSVAKPRGAAAASCAHAGAIFLGRWSSEAIGDYCAGPNHVLPTAGTARFSSPLGVYDFQKRTSLIQVSRAGARRLGRLAATLARRRRPDAHAAVRGDTGGAT